MNFLLSFIIFMGCASLHAADGDQLSFSKKWRTAQTQKNSLLCVGLDPTVSTEGKLEWCLKIIKEVSPSAAAIKVNYHFVRDLQPEAVKRIAEEIRQQGMVSILDVKIADIGSTNKSGLLCCKPFDAITYCPFPGNIAETVTEAHTQGLGVFTLVLMSNPEFAETKSFKNEKGQTYSESLAEKATKFKSDGIVIGAPSPGNHITKEEIESIKKLYPSGLILVPGVGAQGGDEKLLIENWERNVIINVGRAIINDANPSQKAKEFQDLFNQQLPHKE